MDATPMRTYNYYQEDKVDFNCVLHRSLETPPHGKVRARRAAGERRNVCLG